MAGVGAIFSILGGVVGAIGSIQAGNAQAKAAKFNAQALEQRAQSERDAAAAEASDFRRANRRRLSTARTQRASQGVTMAGSPLFVEEDTVREIALGAARLQHRGVVRGNRMEQDAELSRMRGKAAKTAGMIGAGQSLLGGFASAFG